MFFVYILEAKESKRFYIGQTENLEERVKRHNKGYNRSTRAYIPWVLKWWTERETRTETIKIERELKGIKKRERLIAYVRNNNFRGVAQPGPVPRKRNVDPRKT